MIAEPQCQSEDTIEQRALPVSVVVPTRDRNPELERCLAALARLDPAPREIIVVDNAPRTDGALELATRWHTRYVREDVPGLSRARNRGAREAVGEIVAYIDDDAVPDVGWLRSVRNEFADPRVALVAGKVAPLAANPAFDRLYELAGFAGLGNNRMVVDRDTPGWFEKVNFLPFGAGANLAIRRSAFQLWGGFDQRLGLGTPVPGYEEQHAFLQLIDLGFRLVYSPEACVIHRSPERSAEELRRRGLRRMQASAAYLTLLLVEEPQHRREVLQYLRRKLTATRSNTRDGAAGLDIPLLRRFLARLQGPWLYFKSRSQSRSTIANVPAGLRAR